MSDSQQQRRQGPQLVRALHRAYNDRDRDGMLACLTPDVRWHVDGQAPFAGVHEGHDGLWQNLLEPLWASPARSEDHDVVVHGDHVVSFGAQVHDFGDGPRTYPCVEVFELRDGRVSQRWEFVTGQAELDQFLIRGCAMADQPAAPAQ